MGRGLSQLQKDIMAMAAERNYFAHDEARAVGTSSQATNRALKRLIERGLLVHRVRGRYEDYGSLDDSVFFLAGWCGPTTHERWTLEPNWWEKQSNGSPSAPADTKPIDRDPKFIAWLKEFDTNLTSVGRQRTEPDLFAGFKELDQAFKGGARK
jgi:hypothetical protein